MDFRVPKTERWIKQVKAGDTATINAFFRESDKTEKVRGLTLVGIMDNKIVVVYEENVNAE